VSVSAPERGPTESQPRGRYWSKLGNSMLVSYDGRFMLIKLEGGTWSVWDDDELICRTWTSSEARAIAWTLSRERPKEIHGDD
jgi:hypothetical protein